MNEVFLIFTHIPKTGGTSFINVLRHHYGNALFHIRDIGGHRNFLKARHDNFRALAGHVRYGIHEQINLSEVSFRYVSIVRDPVDRIISAFNFVTAIQGHPEHKEYMRIGLKGYIEKRAWKHNEQVSFFSDKGLSEAIACAKNNYHAIGVVGDLDVFLKKISDVVGIPFNAMPTLNRSKKPLKVTREMVKTIEEVETDDRAFVDYVKRMNRMPMSATCYD